MCGMMVMVVAFVEGGKMGNKENAVSLHLCLHFIQLDDGLTSLLIQHDDGAHSNFSTLSHI